MSTGSAIALNVKLNSPANIASVADQIRKGLSGINANVKLNLSQDSKTTLSTTSAALNQIKSNLQQINKTASVAGQGLNKVTIGLKDIGSASAAINRVTLDMKKLNDNTTQAGNSIAAITTRFSAFVLVAQTVNRVSDAIGAGVTEALDFQRELVRLKQVGDDTSFVVKSIGDEAIRLGKNLGTSSNELIKVASTLRQAGLSANDTKTALETLAKTRLSPSFTDLNNTVEGAIAVLGQFKLQAKDLTGVFDSINSVAKAFAVESNDLVTGIRTAGAAFSQAGGDLNEFLAIFTAIRSQTRESAETIGQGLKTIFTRLQRKDSVDALKNLGINLRDAKGNFVGVYEGIRRIGTGLSQINPRSQQFSDIVEQIGGLRQINKILPLITNQKTIQEALNVAKKSGNSLDKDAAVAQDILIVKLTKLKESFNEIFKILSENKQILGFIDTLTKLGEAAVFLVKKLEPIIPTLALLGGLKIASGVGKVATTLGQKALGFNTGGKIPGKAVGDVQPIMAEGGEFMIKRRIAQKIGYDRLEKLNNGDLPGFATGGEILKNIASSFANTKINSQADLDSFIRSEVDKVYSGQGRPRGDKGYYIKKTDFEQMVRDALGEFKPPVTAKVSGLTSGKTISGSDFGPVAQALNKNTIQPNNFRTIFDSASITRKGDGAEVIKTLKDVAKNTDPNNPVRKSRTSNRAGDISGDFPLTIPDNIGLNPELPNSRGRLGNNRVALPRQSEIPVEIGLNGVDVNSRNRSSAQRVALPRNPELPFEAGLDPATGRVRNRYANIPLPSVNFVRPYAEGDIGLDPVSSRARNRFTSFVPGPEPLSNQEFADATQLGVGGRARNRFNTDTSIATNDPFAVIKDQNIGLSPFIYPGRKRGFNNTPLPPIDFVAPYDFNENAGFDGLTGKARTKANVSSSFNADVLKNQAELAMQKQALAQKRYNVDIPGVGDVNFFRGNDISVNAFNTSARNNRNQAIQNFKNDTYGRGLTPYNAGGIDRSAYTKGNFYGLASYTPTNIGNSGGLRNVQDLFQGKNSASLSKYNKVLDQVTSELYKQVQSLQKGKIKEDQYNLIRDTARKALEDNIKVQTNGRGGIAGFADNSLAQGLSTGPGFFGRIARGFKAVGPTFDKYTSFKNVFGPRQKLPKSNRYVDADYSFNGVGSFYANPGNFFASDGSTNINPKTAFAGLSSDGTVGGTNVATGPKQNRLRNIGKTVGFLGAAALASSITEQNSGGFFGGLGRVAGKIGTGAFLGGSVGSAFGTVPLPVVGTVSGGAAGGIIGGIGGAAKGIYDEFTTRGSTVEDIKKNIFENPTIQAFNNGELTLGKASNEPGKEYGNRIGASNSILTALTRANNISFGALNNLKSSNRGILNYFGNGNDAGTIDFLNKEKQGEISNIKDGGRQLAQSLFQDRLNNGLVNSKNFGEYRKTGEFRQITEALNTVVGDPTQEAAGRNKVAEELRQQVLAMEKEKASRQELVATFDKEQAQLNQLNFAYSKTLSQLNRFFEGLDKASQKLNDGFGDLSFRGSALVGENSLQSFRFKAQDFGPEGQFLNQFGGRGGVVDNLKASLPGLIENAIKIEKNNPNQSFSDNLKFGLTQSGFDKTTIDTILARANSNPKIATDYLSGKAPEVLDNLLKSFEPFVEGFKKLEAEGADAGRKFVQGLNQYAENVNKLNDSLSRTDELRLGGNRERARQEAFDAIGRTSTDFLSLGQLQAPFNLNQQRLTGLNNPSVDNIERLLGQRQSELINAQKNGDAVGVQGAQTAIGQLTQALKNLTDTSRSAAGIQEKLSLAEERFNKVRESVINSTERFINASPSERSGILRNRQAAQFAAVNGLQNLPGGALGRFAQNALAGLDELGNQPIFVGNAQVGVQQRRNRAGRVIGRPRAVFAPQFLPANEVKQGLLGQVGGVGLAANNPEIAGLRELLNRANANALEAQKVLNTTINDTNTKFLTDLKALFTEFFGGAGGRVPDINANALDPNAPNAPAPRPNLKQRRNPFNNPGQALPFVNPLAQPVQQQQQGGMMGTFNDMTVAINKLNTTLGALNIPSEISVKIADTQITLNHNGLELLAQFSKEVQFMIDKRIAEEFSKRAATFINNIPPKI